MRTNSVLRGGSAAAASCVLAACGFGGSHAASVAARHPPAPAASMESPSEKALAGMVDAVGPGGSDAPVNLKFTLRGRPEVGEDDQVDYALVPEAQGLQKLRLVFAALSGIEVVNQSPPLEVVKPQGGVPIFGSVTIRPAEAGVFTLTAAVAVESPSQSVMWDFNIPVIVGGAAPQPQAQPQPVAPQQP